MTWKTLRYMRFQGHGQLAQIPLFSLGKTIPAQVKTNFTLIILFITKKVFPNAWVPYIKKIEGRVKNAT